ncbi:3-ketoacyl-ACP reductase [Rhodococcus sp. SC4]|nr:3-ketoacyl-ACP reductase [Rhodococcus sp. SC4]
MSTDVSTQKATNGRKLEGKVALVTGAARGQGRSHALRLAQEGADIIAVDICKQIDTVNYPMSTPSDLADTVAQVEALGRRITAAEADVRDLSELRKIVDQGARELGSIDIVLANAGVSTLTGSVGEPADVFRDVLEINLFGVWNTVQAAAPLMIEQGAGGAIVLTSSTQGLSGRAGNGLAGTDGYCASKHAVVGLMRTFANWLAPSNIRVNTVHPTGVNTPMVDNEAVTEFLTDHPAIGAELTNLLPVPLVEAIDISNAISWLVSDEARYVTGITLSVDAGFAVK